MFSLHSVCIYGGGDRKEQIGVVQKGVEIVIGENSEIMNSVGYFKIFFQSSLGSTKFSEKFAFLLHFLQFV